MQRYGLRSPADVPDALQEAIASGDVAQVRVVLAGYELYPHYAALMDAALAEAAEPVVPAAVSEAAPPPEEEPPTPPKAEPPPQTRKRMERKK